MESGECHGDGAAAHARDMDDAHAEFIEAVERGRAWSVSAMLAYGAGVNFPKKDSHGCTPLIIACLKGHTVIVTKLLGANANVNQARDDGQTPLLTACMKGHTGMV